MTSPNHHPPRHSTHFIDQLIAHLTINGIIDKRMLPEAPFTDVNDQGLFGVFKDGDQHRVIAIIDGVNANAAERTQSA